MNKCPNCKKTFVDISERCREILGCPKCGLYKVDAERVVANKQQRAPVTTPAAQPAQPVKSEWAKDCEWLKKFTLKMAAEHGYDNFRVTFGKAGSWHEYGTGQHRINYGTRDIQNTRDKGMLEYVTWARYLWSDISTIRRERGAARATEMDGRLGLWGTALHEFGHAIAKENGHRVRGSGHNQGWANAVRELKVLYPYDECQNI